MMIIDPVIVRPLRAQWNAARAVIETALANGARGRAEAQACYLAFTDRLAAYRVLDPACGSGNFTQPFSSGMVSQHGASSRRRKRPNLQ